MIKSLNDIWDPNVFLKKLVWIAVVEKASDIHITPLKEKIIVRFRIAWNMKDYFNIFKRNHSKIINVIKDRAWMNNQIKTPQDWKIVLETAINETSIWLNLRVSTLPTIYWENIVMRILITDTKTINLNSLWFSKHHIDKLKNINKLKNWLVLSAWWTWSWKTTTLYSLLWTFDSSEKTIFTLEDPIEYIVDWYIQSEVKHNLSDWEWYDFNKWLRWLLRQDPDIILVWEIRDRETAWICFESANTWHVVFGSIHANSALLVTSRLFRLWIKPYMLATWLKYIIYQKLFKKLCPHCLKVKEISLNEYLDENNLFKEDIQKIHFANKKWCEKCKEWYLWLISTAEIIEIDDDIVQIIFENKSMIDFKNYLNTTWFISILEDWIYKSIKWEIDFFSVLSLKG
jgi:type IV pilus assembly protein PilB